MANNLNNMLLECREVKKELNTDISAEREAYAAWVTDAIVKHKKNLEKLNQDRENKISQIASLADKRILSASFQQKRIEMINNFDDDVFSKRKKHFETLEPYYTKNKKYIKDILTKAETIEKKASELETENDSLYQEWPKLYDLCVLFTDPKFEDHQKFQALGKDVNEVAHKNTVILRENQETLDKILNEVGLIRQFQKENEEDMNQYIESIDKNIEYLHSWYEKTMPLEEEDKVAKKETTTFPLVLNATIWKKQPNKQHKLIQKRIENDPIKYHIVLEAGDDRPQLVSVKTSDKPSLLESMDIKTSTEFVGKNDLILKLDWEVVVRGEKVTAQINKGNSNGSEHERNKNGELTDSAELTIGLEAVGKVEDKFSRSRSRGWSNTNKTANSNENSSGESVEQEFTHIKVGGQIVYKFRQDAVLNKILIDDFDGTTRKFSPELYLLEFTNEA